MGIEDRIIWKGIVKDTIFDRKGITRKYDRNLFWATKMYARVNKYKGE